MMVHMTMFTSIWATTKMHMPVHPVMLLDMIMFITSQMFFSMHLSSEELDSTVMMLIHLIRIPVSILAQLQEQRLHQPT